jgi:hypothetical protein
VSFTATGRRSGFTLDATFSAILLRRTGDSLPYELFVISDDGGAGGVNIINAPPGPALRTGLNDPGEIDLNFGILFGLPATRTFEVQLRIPAGVDLSAGNLEARFDVKYLCESRFLGNQTGTTPQGFVMTIPVSSALQASLVGAGPDFGEIGNLSSAAVATAPLATTERRHFLRVASSGPYEIRIDSQNAWRMSATGTQTSAPAELIAYRYALLGQTLDNSRRTFTPVLCRTTGTGGQLIPITATLTEGGLGKTPSPTYRDIVTVTVTPLATAQSGSARSCP